MCQDYPNIQVIRCLSSTELSTDFYLSKLLEQHIHSLVSKHLADNSPISRFQWGFMPRRSAISALCSLSHEWSQELDNGNEVCSVFLDLRKAFNSVPHIQATLNFCLHLLQWIQSYLSERSQVVAVGGELSTTCVLSTTGLCPGTTVVCYLYR